MADAAREEVRQAVDRAVENLKTLAEKNPSAGVGGDDFNRLLERARSTFSDVPSIGDIARIDGGTTMGELMFKLSILQGAVHSWFSERSRRAVAEHNRRIERENRW